MEKDQGFSKLRSFFWPIHRVELKKFVPMAILFFFISFNYHILKILKDTLIITAPNSGAEVIPFLKVWAILPSAIGLTYLFTKLSRRFNRENIFYVMISIFLIFFTFFIFVLYPHNNFFNLNKTADFLSGVLPKGFKGLILIIRYWPFAIFYIMAEAWSTIMLSLLLWMFVVDVLSVSEAKRSYFFFGVARNSAGILAGILGHSLATRSALNFSNSSLFSFFGFNSSWDQAMAVFIIIIILCGLCIIFLYRYLHINLFPTRYLMGSDASNKGKQKITLKECISFAMKSKYVLYIAIIVLSYNVVINLTEVLWKSQVHELFPSALEFTKFSSKITYLIGIIAVISSFVISSNVVRKLGWRIAAILTPLTLIFTGFGFFYCIFVKKASIANATFNILGFSPLVLAVFFGALQNILARALKYTIFDDTKEMAFIPLSAEDKLKGKSAIDGIGSRLGKSGSSLIIQMLLMTFSSPMGASPFIFIVFALIMPVWIVSINRLSKKFEVAQRSIAS
ncbi:MAG: ADP,ATP carrier protein 1 [Candidatus Anoxychlamydiales bacterium]|nr:ADP,ATP carrier protein 1 [Candidatus Anoxychlamydiales bacterium]